MSGPRREHGETLDRIFRATAAERVLLVDSDVELIAGEMVENIRAMLGQNERMYGSGSLHRAEWFKSLHPTDLPIASGIAYVLHKQHKHELRRPVCEVLSRNLDPLL